MKFDIHLKTEQSEPSDRVKAILSDFDMTFDHTKEDIQGDIDIDGADWCIGAIIGGSGTGKSTIAKELFGSHYVNGYEYTGKSVVDDMPSSASVSDIEQAFSAVGFSSPPSWLKPYSVLSTGEKMRVDLARAILQESDMVVFDEFTSVVDRTIAKTASYAVQKAIRKNGGGQKVYCSFVPQGYSGVVNARLGVRYRQEKFFWLRGEHHKPHLQLDVYRLGNGHKERLWDVFRKYHYLNTTLHPAATQYVGILNGEILACHTGVIQAAMKKGTKRVHRFVVLPDFQGIGIGLKFINFIAGQYIKQGLKFNLITTTPAIRCALERSDKWRLRRSGNVTPPGKSKLMAERYEHLKKSFSCSRVTYSFDFIENNNN